MNTLMLLWSFYIHVSLQLFCQISCPSTNIIQHRCTNSNWKLHEMLEIKLLQPLLCLFWLYFSEKCVMSQLLLPFKFQHHQKYVSIELKTFFWVLRSLKSSLPGEYSCRTVHRIQSNTCPILSNDTHYYLDFVSSLCLSGYISSSVPPTTPPLTLVIVQCSLVIFLFLPIGLYQFAN